MFFAITIPAFGFDLVLQWDEYTEPDLATGTKARYKIYQAAQSMAGDKTKATLVTPVKVSDDQASDPLIFQKSVLGLDGNMTYFFCVTALDEAGNESLLSNEVSTIGLDTDEAAPKAPEGVKIWKIIKQFLSKLLGRLGII